MHYFWKKDAFGAVERRLLKKTLGKFSRILSYWKLFGLVIFSSYSSKACKTSFYFFFKKLALFLKKRRFWCSGTTFRKKHSENFQVSGPIWNFSYLQYFICSSNMIYYKHKNINKKPVQNSGQLGAFEDCILMKLCWKMSKKELILTRFR